MIYPPSPRYPAGPGATVGVMLSRGTLATPPPASAMGQRAQWYNTGGIKYDSWNGLGPPILGGVPVPPSLPGQHQTYHPGEFHAATAAAAAVAAASNNAAVPSPWQDKLRSISIHALCLNAPWISC